jgi:hypothetical protein
VYATCFYCFGFFTLLVLQLIRARLKKCHPGLFSSLGSPTFQDSNVGKTYWALQKFIWWGYRSEVSDSILRGLCMLASLSELAVVIFFFLIV